MKLKDQEYMDYPLFTSVLEKRKNAIFISCLVRLWAVTKYYRLEIRVPETGVDF